VAHTIATTGISADLPLHHEVFDWLGLLDVRLSLVPQALLVEVWDSGIERPDGRLAGSLALQAASDFGFHITEMGQRLVWCTVPAQPADPEQTFRLPRLPRRRATRHPEGRTAALVGDPKLLQQVLDGLQALDVGKETEC